MHYSLSPMARAITVLALLASLGIVGSAWSDELFAPAELAHLRQVSQALLVSRAAERQRLLEVSSLQRQTLADVDSRLRNLEGAVRDDNMPRLQFTPTAPALVTTGSLAPAATANANTPPNTSTAGHDQTENSTKVTGRIDDVLAGVSAYKQSLAYRATVGSGAPTTNSARSNASQNAAGTVVEQSDAKLSAVLDAVDLELRGMRAHGADLQSLTKMRKQLSLSGPPATRDVEPTFQTITRHYR